MSAADYVARLRRRIIAAAIEDRLRVGFHAFNTEEDVVAFLPPGPRRRANS